MASFLIIFAAWQRRVPQVTVARMVVNVAIDTLLGAVPFAGDAFDIAWKSNRKNLGLLQRASSPLRPQQTWRDWLFLVAIAGVMALLIAVPLVVLWAIVHVARTH